MWKAVIQILKEDIQPVIWGKYYFGRRQKLLQTKNSFQPGQILIQRVTHKRFREDAAEEKVPVEKLIGEKLPVLLARNENRENSMTNTFYSFGILYTLG